MGAEEGKGVHMPKMQEPILQRSKNSKEKGETRMTEKMEKKIILESILNLEKSETWQAMITGSFFGVAIASLHEPIAFTFSSILGVLWLCGVIRIHLGKSKAFPRFQKALLSENIEKKKVKR
jgi:hypothetical protein